MGGFVNAVIMTSGILFRHFIDKYNKTFILKIPFTIFECNIRIKNTAPVKVPCF